MTETDTLLQVQDLTVDFRAARGLFSRQRVRAVDRVSMTVNPGETVGVVGESGSGKTTVGRSILGLLKPDDGSITFDGQPAPPRTRRARHAYYSNVQVVFQDPLSSLNQMMRIGSIIAEPLRQFRDIRQAAAREAEICDLLESVGLDPAMQHRFPQELSGGQRQRVAIARALAPRPRLIVCDEAVSALDVSTQAQIINLFADLRDRFGIAYLFIAHDLAIVRQISHRVYVMRQGQVVETGPVEQVHDDPHDPYTRALLAAAPVPDPERQRTRIRARRAAVATRGEAT